MNFIELPGSSQQTHYTENGLVDFSKLMHNLMHDKERNKLIAVHLGVRYAAKFLVVVSHLGQAHLIEQELCDKSSVQTISINEIDEYLKDPTKTLHARIVFMDFHTFDKIIEANIHMHTLFHNYSGVLIATPHKDIKHIINYLYVNKLKMTIYDINDQHDILSVWANRHSDEFELFKVLHHIK